MERSRDTFKIDLMSWFTMCYIHMQSFKALGCPEQKYIKGDESAPLSSQSMKYLGLIGLEIVCFLYNFAALQIANEVRLMPESLINELLGSRNLLELFQRNGTASMRGKASAQMMSLPQIIKNCLQIFELLLTSVCIITEILISLDHL